MRYRWHSVLTVLLAIVGRIVAAKPTGSDNVAVDDYVSGLEAQGLANHMKTSDDEPLTDEEQETLYKLYNEGFLTDDDFKDAVGAEREIELELEAPPQAEHVDEAALEQLMQELAEQREDERGDERPIQVTQEHATPAPPVQAVKKTMHKNNGEAEFETFTDPQYVGANSMVKENPTVNVKRANVLEFNDNNGNANTNLIFMGVVGICATVAMVGTVIAGTAYYKLQSAHAASQSAHDMNTISGPAKDRMRKAVARGDQKNAYSAQLHHYQQTKNEIIRIEQQGGHARDESDEESENGDEPDYSVYECPGLAPTGDIEVSNPMFDQTKK